MLEKGSQCRATSWPRSGGGWRSRKGACGRRPRRARRRTPSRGVTDRCHVPGEDARRWPRPSQRRLSRPRSTPCRSPGAAVVGIRRRHRRNATGMAESRERVRAALAQSASRFRQKHHGQFVAGRPAQEGSHYDLPIACACWRRSRGGAESLSHMWRSARSASTADRPSRASCWRRSTPRARTGADLPACRARGVGGVSSNGCAPDLLASCIISRERAAAPPAAAEVEPPGAGRT